MKSISYIFVFLLLIANILHSQYISLSNPQNLYFVDENIEIKIADDTFDFVSINGSDGVENYFFGRISSKEQQFSFQIPYVKSKFLRLKANFEKYSEPKIIWYKENAHPSEIRSIQFVAQDFVLVTSSAREVNFWDIGNRKLIRTVNLQQFGQIRFVLPTRTADTLFVGTVDGIYMFDGKNMVVKNFGQDVLSGNVRRIVHHPSKKQIAFGADSGFVGIFDYVAFDFVKTYRVDKNPDGNEIYSIAYSSTGDSLVCGAYNGSLYLIDTKTDIVHKFGSHGINNQNTVVFDVAFARSHPYIVSAAADAMVRLWRLPTFQLEKVLDYHLSHIRSITLDQKDKILLSFSLDSNINFIDFLTGELFYQYAYKSQLLHSSLSNNGRYFAASGRDGSFVIFELPEAISKQDSITLNCGYKFNVALSRLSGQFGEKKSVDINVQHKYNPQKMPIEKYIIELNSTYPPSLLLWENESKAGEIKHRLNGDVYRGIIDKLNFALLGNSAGADFIKINEIKTIDPEFYYFFGDSAEVVTRSNCTFDTSKTIIATENPYMFANFSSNILTLDLFLVEDGRYSMKIYNIAGQEIFSFETLDLTNGYAKIIKKLNLPCGIYFVNLISQSGFVLNTKFIVN